MIAREPQDRFEVSPGKARRKWKWKRWAVLAAGVVLALLVGAFIYYKVDDDPPVDHDMEFVLLPGTAEEGNNPVDFCARVGPFAELVTTGSGLSLSEYRYPKLADALAGDDNEEKNWNENWRETWPAEDSQLYVENHAPQLRELRAALARPASEWDFHIEFIIEYRVPEGITVPPQALIIEAFDSLYRGDPESALETGILCIQVSNRIAERMPLLIGQLVAAGWRSEGIKICEKVLRDPQSNLSSERLRSFLAQLQELGPRQDWGVRAWKGEYQIGKNLLTRMEESSAAAESGPVSKFVELLFYNENKSLRLLHEKISTRIKDLKVPRTSREGHACDWSHPGFFMKNRNGIYLVELYASFGNDTLLMEVVRHRAYMLRVALLIASRDNNGRLPANLSALVPGILPSLPLDPFNGQDLGYNPWDGIVYSVGPNRKDDGGGEVPDPEDFPPGWTHPPVDDFCMPVFGAGKSGAGKSAAKDGSKSR